MQTIFGDFNGLGIPHEDAVGLWDDDRFREAGIVLTEGEQVIVREDGELEAIGIVHKWWSEGWGKWFWYADIDMSTLHVLPEAEEHLRKLLAQQQ